MSKNSKLLDRLLSRPKDFTWDELIKILKHFGYSEMRSGKTGGSRRKFADDTRHIINLHKPHPGNILKSYQINQVIEILNERKKINE